MIAEILRIIFGKKCQECQARRTPMYDNEYICYDCRLERELEGYEFSITQNSAEPGYKVDED